MDFKRKGCKNKGITLIALVITIIVLLILVGVTIALLSGDNSAPQKATEASQKDAIAGAKDEIAMEAQERLLEYYNNSYVKGNKTEGASTQSVVQKATEDAVKSAKTKNKELEESEVDGNTIILNTKSYTVIGTINNDGGITWSDIITGESGTETDEPKVGDIVNYEPSGSYDWDKSLAESTATSVGLGVDKLSSAPDGNYHITQWKILSYNPNTKMIEMVPTEPVGNLKLQGAQGYNNAVYLLNEACRNLYENSNKGITARSIKEEDFVKAGGEEWEDKKLNFENPYAITNTSGGKVKYGEQKSEEYTTNKKYPSIYEYEKNSVISPTSNADSKILNQSEQTNPINATDNEATNGYKNNNLSIKPYQTYYNTTILGDKKEILLPNQGSTQYWVASRCVYLDRNFCYFDIYCVNSSSLNGYGLFHSNGACNSPSFALFPVVSLSSRLLEESGVTGTFNVK